jgi:hypothetical protein
VFRRLVALALVLAARDAGAYEFWLHTETIGQAYDVPQYTLAGPYLLLARRRITQTLALRIDDVGDLAAARRKSRLPERGLRVSLQMYLRVDHDFGDFTSGQMILPGPIVRDALDVIPELGQSVAALDLMYGYVQLDGLLDDKLRVQLGRVLADDGWGATAIDGAGARYAVAGPIEVGATAGLRVRASSPLGNAAYELDGTSGAGCEEYIAGATPGTGSWQLIDRNRTITNSTLSSDYEYCPQRDVAQPSVGVTIAAVHLKHLSAELGYRRTWSDTVEALGPAQGVDQPTQPLYPSEFPGELPATGVNEERVYGRVQGRFDAAGVELAPYADARYSVVDALFDRADAGVRVHAGGSVIEPSIEYFYPTFDADSIFNAFSIEPTTDVRVGYRYDAHGPWRATADAWLRHYGSDDGEPEYAGGGDAGVERAIGASWRAKLDALADDGWGGARVGGGGEAAWKYERFLWLRGRVIVLGVRDDDASLYKQYTTSSTVVSGTIQVADFVAIHAMAEADYDAVHELQMRVIGVLDFAFMPEP